jgi:hypothetical protein
MEQRYYAVSVDRYKVVLHTEEGITTHKLWGTEGGIKEWIANNEVPEPEQPATYKITKRGVVQQGEPIPEMKF